jgi:hypothetical protein
MPVQWRVANIDDDQLLIDLSYKASEILQRDGLGLASVDRIESKNEMGTYYRLSVTACDENDQFSKRSIVLHDNLRGISEVNEP